MGSRLGRGGRGEAVIGSIAYVRAGMSERTDTRRELDHGGR